MSCVHPLKGGFKASPGWSDDEGVVYVKRFWSGTLGIPDGTDPFP